MTERYFGFPALVLEPGVRTGMPILYDNPKEVGPDRIANAVGAYDLYGGPTIVVDFGTATTIEAISAEGEYLGGAIFPGVEIAMDALFGRAAGLRRVELQAAEARDRQVDRRVDPVGRDLRLQRAGRRLVDRFVAELGECTVIATGGLAELISPHARTVQHYEPWLTLYGLRIIFERNTLMEPAGDERRRATASVGARSRRCARAARIRIRCASTAPHTLAEVREHWDDAGRDRRRRATTSCTVAGRVLAPPGAGQARVRDAARRTAASCSSS